MNDSCLDASCASRHLHIPDETSDSNHASVVTVRFSFLQTNLYTTGSEDEDRFADEVFHQPKAVCTTGGECAFAGGDLHHHILSVAVDEMVNVGTGFPLYPEHRMQSPDHVHVQHP